ncbi:MAG: protein kinase [Myxococcales bacterium]|nr:protein kinase [Myxococcales bacterium]MDD9970667.1 protein kinase [Myxococcales bacterium]
MSSRLEQSGANLGRLGPYQLVRRLGAGGMAEVFEARRVGPRGFTKRVALKRILPHVAEEPAFVDMFVAEASLVASLSHPNVVQVFDFGEADGSLYLAMELVEGTTVSRMMRVLAARGDAVPLEVALALISAAARGLAHAHEARTPDGEPMRLVHRDVSPGNLLIGHTGHLKLTDFGIACTDQCERHTTTDHLRGKVGYMSPQQVIGEDLDEKSDVFTLSVVLAELLIGESLFARGSDLEVLLRIRDVDLSVLDKTQRQLPADVRRIVHLGLATDPRARPTARKLADTLDAMLLRRGKAVDQAAAVAQLLYRYELVDASVTPAPCSVADRPTGLVPLDDATAPLANSLAPGQRSEAPRAASYHVDVPASLGPAKVSFPELVRLATTGVVSAGTIVRRDQSTPKRACELPELSRVFSTPALQWDEGEFSRPRLRGELSAAMLLPLIHSLAANRETGMLYLEDQGRRKKVYFVDGRPDFVASNDRRGMLGEYLVQNDLCMPMELDMALAMMPRFDGRLGDALVNLGMMRPVELYRAVSGQVRHRYLEAFRWRSGQWRYVRGAQSMEETYPIEQDAQVLMRDAASELDASELEAALSPLWERVVRPVVRPPAPLSSYQLPDSWNWMIDRARGEATVGSLFGHGSVQSGLDGEDAMRAIFLGLSCQLLEAA